MTSDAETQAPETFTPQTAAALRTSALRLADIVLRYANGATTDDATVPGIELDTLTDEFEAALRAFNTAAFHHTGTAALLLDPR
ncbi:hypothetical protein [Isoptericola sp. NPDC019482]|uniref:hypothetical protein n=1 Tax=Isoptericola sp. NPDC019482 TaxID=3154688 RepID=UPI0034861C97